MSGKYEKEVKVIWQKTKEEQDVLTSNGIVKF